MDQMPPTRVRCSYKHPGSKKLRNQSRSEQLVAIRAAEFGRRRLQDHNAEARSAAAVRRQHAQEPKALGFGQ